MPEEFKGRFRKQMNSEATDFSSSLSTDFKLYREDIEGSIAHARMLGRKKIIPAKDASAIVKALKEIRNEIQSGRLSLAKLLNNNKRFTADDIHMAIEGRLIEQIGETGGKLHTARSRNDQVQTDMRLYLRKEISSISILIRRLQKTLVKKAEANIDIVMPGYTHLQQAQPILLAHHLLAYVSMLERDNDRLNDCSKRVNKNPLGAGALAGTTFPIDRAYTSELLGFDAPIMNSMDAVSDRDVHIEFLSACSIIMMHLSRLAEELIIWSSNEWHFAVIGDEFTTGSSMMPQKKNPDIAELIRGKTGRVYGSLVNLLTMMKALPLAYNRDMQEDKEPVFDASETVKACLSIFAKMMRSVSFDSKTFYNDSSNDYFLATDVADYLTSKKVPFRKAHSIAGSIVNFCVSKNVELKDITIEILRGFSPLFQKDIYKILNVKESINQKKSEGSTSPKEVSKAIRYWKKKL